MTTTLQTTDDMSEGVAFPVADGDARADEAVAHLVAMYLLARPGLSVGEGVEYVERMMVVGKALKSEIVLGRALSRATKEEG